MVRLRVFRTNREAMIFLMGFLLILTVSDAVVTRILITRGIAEELNPFLQVLVRDKDFVGIKCASGLLADLILWDVYEKRAGVAVFSTALFVIFYTAIVFWNLLLLSGFHFWMLQAL